MRASPTLGIRYDPASGATKDLLEQYDFGTEVGPELSPEKLDGILPRVRSAHAPWNDKTGRLNIAAVSPDYRAYSRQVITGFISRARAMLPRLELIVIHPAPRRWWPDRRHEGREGDYELLLEGLRRLAEHAQAAGLRLVLENNNRYWENANHELTAECSSPSDNYSHFADNPEEWLQVWRDVGRDNFGLCLDPAHAVTWAHTIDDPGRRAAGLMKYLDCPEAIRHVHWNDQYAFEKRGRVDQHLCIGTGSIPKEMHRRIKGLKASLLLEHFHGSDALEAELDYIAGL